MKLKKLICEKYSAVRLLLTFLSVFAFFLPIAIFRASLPYFERSVALGAAGLKQLLASGLFSCWKDILGSGVLKTEAGLGAAVCLLTVTCAAGVWAMLFLCAVSFSKPKRAAKALKIAAVSVLGANAVLILLGIVLQIKAGGSAVFSFTPGAGAFVLAALLILMLICDSVYLKSGTDDSAAPRPKLTKLLVLFLCLVIVSGTSGFVLGRVVSRKAPEPTVEETQPEGAVYVDKLPETSKEAYALVLLKIRNVLYEKKERVEGTRALTVGEIEGTLTEAQKNVLNSISGDIAAGISTFFARSFVEYGEDTQGSLPDIAGFSETEDYTARIVNGNAFEISMRYGQEPAGALQSEETAQALSAAKQAFAELVTVNSVAMDAKKAEVFTRINEVNGVLNVLEVRVTYNVSLNCTFTGELSALGEQTVAFELTDTASYAVTREGVYIPANEYHMKPGQSLSLNATLNVPESFTPYDYKITYTSSNPNLLTVDENGRVHALAASDKPVSVTVLMEFTNTVGVFYDYCEIWISEK